MRAEVSGRESEIRVPIPEGVRVEVDPENVIRVSGPLGSVEKPYNGRMIEISVEDGEVRLAVFGRRKFHRAYLGTMASHVRNMIEGVTRGFRKEMVIVFSHFPIRVEIDEENKVVKINNFLGEKSPRYARIVGSAKVRLEGGDRIVIEGPSKDDVGQTAANIRQATKIRGKDPRVFMDGIYVVE